MAKSRILLAKNFELPKRAITESIAIMGRKGSGKTYTGGRLFEQMYAAGAQCVALDPVGNWWGLRLSASGKRRGLDIPVFGGEHGDIPITPESGRLIAEVIVQRGLSCVIDLMLFRKGQRKKFVTDFAEELFNLKKRKRSPLHLFLEEARKFIPQKPFGPDENRMIGAFEDIVRLGRNYGLGASLIDQRPQSVNKEVLSQTELLIVHQLTGSHERKVIKEWVQDKADKGKEALGHLSELHPGDCFFWSPGLMRTFAKVSVGKKTTFDASSTPELGDNETGIETKPLSDKDMAKLQESMAVVVEEADGKDPKKLQHKVKKQAIEIKGLQQKLELVCRELESRPEEVEKVEVPTVSMEQVIAIDEIAGRVERAAAPFGKELAHLAKVVDELKIAACESVGILRENKKSIKSQVVAGVGRRNGVKASNKGGVRSRPVAASKKRRYGTGAPEGGLTGPEQRIVDALAWLEQIGVERPENNAVAFLAGYRPGGGGYNNPKGRLRVKGLIEYAPGKRLYLTETGRAAAAPPAEALSTDALHQQVLGRLSGPESRILQPLLDSYPEPMSNEDLAQAASYKAGSGGYNNPRGRLRTLGIIEYPEPNMVRACDILFLG